MDTHKHVFEYSPDSILVVHHQVHFFPLNPQAEKKFGDVRNERLGQLVEILTRNRFAPCHLEQQHQSLKMPITKSENMGRNSFSRRKVGSEFPVEITLSSAVNTEPDWLGLYVIRNVSKRMEVLAQESRRRELLLKEVHHRVTNHLHIVSSVLFRRSRQIRDPSARGALQELQNRVCAIASLHDRLHRSNDGLRREHPRLDRRFGLHLCSKRTNHSMAYPDRKAPCLISTPLCLVT